jgi:hypothetical protein
MDGARLMDGQSLGGGSLDPNGLVSFIGGLWIPITVAGLVMGALYVLATMLAGVSTMRYAIVGFFGRRGQGKSFSQVYYARKWGQRYRDKDVWTNMARLEIEGRHKCTGKPREWGAAITADGRTKRDAGFTLRHHVHNEKDCLWCKGVKHPDHSWEACFRCELEACDRPYTAPVHRDKKTKAQWCEISEKVPVPLVHVEAEYMDFAGAFDGLVVVDEAGQVFASTMWSKLPYAALKFMADTRKRRLLLLYSAHTPARVSKNLRELTDEAFECQNFKGFGFFKLTHFEGCLVEKDHTSYTPFLPSVQASYDTEEIVTPPGGLASISEAVGRKEVKASEVAKQAA